MYKVKSIRISVQFKYMYILHLIYILYTSNMYMYKMYLRTSLDKKRMNECMNKYCIVYKGLPVNPFTQY